jgi:hypothetical protein
MINSGNLDLPAGPLDLTEMYRVAYAAWPDYLAFLERDGRPICRDTLMLAERLPEMASALFVAGYTTALVDARPSPGAREAELRMMERHAAEIEVLKQRAFEAGLLL